MAERDEDGFLERWSRRKRGEASPGALESETAAAEPESQESQESPDTGDPEVVAKLPDLDSLTEDSDFTAFLQDGVPEVIRRKALRRLWRLNPVFANLDGLNDYDEDFSALGIVAENIKTLYKVGKGYLDEDEDEDEDKDKDKDKDEAEIAADDVGEDKTGTAEGGAEPESRAARDSATPNSDDPLESTKLSQTAPGYDSAPMAVPDLETKSVKPARGTALARRWGANPDKG